jgi:hypothetical protein
VLEDGRGAGDRRLDARGRDELAFRDRVVEQLRLRESEPVAQPLLRERTQNPTVVVEDAAIPVAEGSRLE